MTRALVGAALAALVLAATATAGDAADPAQLWIHRHYPMCCDHRDCRPARADRLKSGGWVVLWEGQVLPYSGPVRASPAGATYACVLAGVVRCLFVAGGSS